MTQRLVAGNYFTPIVTAALGSGSGAQRPSIGAMSSSAAAGPHDPGRYRCGSGGSDCASPMISQVRRSAAGVVNCVHAAHADGQVHLSQDEELVAVIVVALFAERKNTTSTPRAFRAVLWFCRGAWSRVASGASDDADRCAAGALLRLPRRQPPREDR